MMKGLPAAGIIAIGVALLIVSLLPAELILTWSQSASSDSYVLKGLARWTAWGTGVTAFVLGGFAAWLWARRAVRK